MSRSDTLTTCEEEFVAAWYDLQRVPPTPVELMSTDEMLLEMDGYDLRLNVCLLRLLMGRVASAMGVARISFGTKEEKARFQRVFSVMFKEEDFATQKMMIRAWTHLWERQRVYRSDHVEIS